MDLDDIVGVGNEDDQKGKDRRQQESGGFMDFDFLYDRPADPDAAKNAKCTKKCCALGLVIVLVLMGGLAGLVVYLVSGERGEGWKYVSHLCTINSTHPSDYYNYNGMTDPCGVGWKFYEGGNKCYRVSNETASWSVAQGRCKAEGGRLLTIPNVWTRNHLYYYFRAVLETDVYWIGLERDRDGIDYTWPDGSMLSNFTNWAPDEPYGAGRCILFYYDQEWGNFPCDWKIRHHICEKIDTSASCHSDWSFFQEEGKCIRAFMYTYLDHEGARSHCNARNSSLLTITSEMKQQFASAILPVSTVYSKFWIGLSTNEDDNWRWVDDSKLFFKNWKKGSPEDITGEKRCGYMDKHRRWHDVSCGMKMPYICEKRGPGCEYRNGFCNGICFERDDDDWSFDCIRCPRGFGPKNGTCCDIDECTYGSTYSRCNHSCINQFESYYCSRCERGYEYDVDTETCELKDYEWL